MTREELEQEVIRLQTELTYAVMANKAIMEQHHDQMDEVLEDMEGVTITNVGLSVENSEQRTYIHRLEACVAATRAGKAAEGLAELDAWLAEKKKRAA